MGMKRLWQSRSITHWKKANKPPGLVLFNPLYAGFLLEKEMTLTGLSFLLFAAKLLPALIAYFAWKKGKTKLALILVALSAILLAFAPVKLTSGTPSLTYTNFDVKRESTDEFTPSIDQRYSQSERDRQKQKAFEEFNQRKEN